jgi:hypothetical protein
MPKILCQYAVHFVEITGKYREPVKFEGTCLADLIPFLDQRSGDFLKELIDPSSGELFTRNAVLLERAQESTRAISLTSPELRDGDVLTFF